MGRVITIEMPRYQCHKQVWALKIRAVTGSARPDIARLVPEDERFAPIAMPAVWVAQHDPQPGGYLVVYEDGHHSYASADVFEAGYTLVH